MAWRQWARRSALSVLLGVAACGGGEPGPSSSGGDAGEATASTEPVRLSVADASVAEGDKGDVELDFVVTLSAPSVATVQVEYATEDDSAHAAGNAGQGDDDYDRSSGTLEFAPGETEQHVLISVHGDVIHETDDTLLLRLRNARGAGVSDAEAVGTIENDDPEAALPTLSISDATWQEGDRGKGQATLEVKLSRPSTLPVGVSVATTAGTASEGDDYDAVDAVLVFSPGQTTRRIRVPIVGDQIVEADETLGVALIQPQNAELDMAEATLTIANDDDNLPAIAVNDVTLTEGDAGKTLSFDVTLSAVSVTPVSVDYATENASAVAGGDAAIGQDDYVPLSGTLIFAPGESAKQIKVTVNGDELYEDPETFVLQLSNPVGGLIADDVAAGRINDDEVRPELSASSFNVGVGEGAGVATMKLTLSGASGLPVSFEVMMTDYQASPDDYDGTPQSLHIDPGETEVVLTIPIIDDGLDEPDETFNVYLQSGTNAFVDTNFTVTILDDDP